VIKIDGTGNSLRVDLDPTVPIQPNCEFVLKYQTDKSGLHGCTLMKDPATQEYAAMISFIPSFLDPGEEVDDLEGSGEYIFVLDCSGSMSG
jgi:hypothetical protein